MDRFGQIGPEKGDYDADVSVVAHALRYGGRRAVTLALTHRLTRQQITLALKTQMEIIGEELGGGPPGTTSGPFLFVAVDEKGAYWFRIDLANNGGYVASKLGLARPDGDTVADFLNRLGRALGWDVQPSRAVIREVV